MTHSIHDKIRILETQLQELNIQKAALEEELQSAHIELGKASSVALSVISVEIGSVLSLEEKIKIFMNLFRGRMEVFPKRWDNLKTNKSGYSPVCSNEWTKRTCNKPQIKCSECPNSMQCSYFHY